PRRTGAPSLYAFWVRNPFTRARTSTSLAPKVWAAHSWTIGTSRTCTGATTTSTTLGAALARSLRHAAASSVTAQPTLVARSITAMAGAPRSGSENGYKRMCLVAQGDGIEPRSNTAAEGGGRRLALALSFLETRSLRC